jgi:hypothetical protein
LIEVAAWSEKYASGSSDSFVKVTIGVVLSKLRQGCLMKLGQHH